MKNNMELCGDIAFKVQKITYNSYTSKVFYILSGFVIIALEGVYVFGINRKKNVGESNGQKINI